MLPQSATDTLDELGSTKQSAVSVGPLNPTQALQHLG